MRLLGALLVALWITPVASACSLGPWARGEIVVTDIRSGAEVALAPLDIEATILGPDCRLHPPHDLSGDELAWSDGGTLHTQRLGDWVTRKFDWEMGEIVDLEFAGRELVIWTRASSDIHGVRVEKGDAFFVFDPSSRAHEPLNVSDWRGNGSSHAYLGAHWIFFFSGEGPNGTMSIFNVTSRGWQATGLSPSSLRLPTGLFPVAIEANWAVFYGNSSYWAVRLPDLAAFRLSDLPPYTPWVGLSVDTLVHRPAEDDATATRMTLPHGAQENLGAVSRDWIGTMDGEYMVLGRLGGIRPFALPLLLGLGVVLVAIGTRALSRIAKR